jgi:hypothetical protein
MADFDPDTVVASSATISDKIRQLAAAGYSRSQIAELIGRSYQQVRQVLIEDERRAGRRTPAAPAAPAAPVAPAAPLATPALGPGVAEPSGQFGGLFRLEVEEGGVVRLPPAVLAALSVSAGSVLISELCADHLTVLSPRAAMAKVDALMAPFKWAGGPMASEELIAERRAEAARDSHD